MDPAPHASWHRPERASQAPAWLPLWPPAAASGPGRSWAGRQLGRQLGRSPRQGLARWISRTWVRVFFFLFFLVMPLSTQRLCPGSPGVSRPEGREAGSPSEGSCGISRSDPTGGLGRDRGAGDFATVSRRARPAPRGPQASTQRGRPGGAPRPLCRPRPEFQLLRFAPTPRSEPRACSTLLCRVRNARPLERDASATAPRPRAAPRACGLARPQALGRGHGPSASRTPCKSHGRTREVRRPVGPGAGRCRPGARPASRPTFEDPPEFCSRGRAAPSAPPRRTPPRLRLGRVLLPCR